MSKMVMGEVKEVKVGVVNTHLGTWYSETEDRWSEVKINCTLRGSKAFLFLGSKFLFSQN